MWFIDNGTQRYLLGYTVLTRILMSGKKATLMDGPIKFLFFLHKIFHHYSFPLQANEEAGFVYTP